MQTFIHYFLHFVAPFGIALLFFNKDWKTAYILFLLTMLVDLDHLSPLRFFKLTAVVFIFIRYILTTQ